MLIKKWKDESLITGLDADKKPIYSWGNHSICKVDAPLNQLALLLGYPSFFHWIVYCNHWNSVIEELFFEAEVYTKDLDNEDSRFKKKNQNEKNKQEKRLG